MVSALAISHLTKVYRGGTVAVSDISLTVEEGDFFGFLGQNGAGKSSAIHCVTGIATPSSGKIEIFGVDAVKDYREARRFVGLCPQEFNVDTFCTPYDIVDFTAGYFGMAASERRSRTAMLLEMLGLAAHAKKRFRELSGGLKRRVMLARALVNDPKLLILDEPTAGVDIETRHILWDYFEKLNADGVTIMLTSHYMEEVERLCRTIAIVNAGKIISAGSNSLMASSPGGLEALYLEVTKSKHCGAPAA